jgi:hypothetical protein
VNPTSHGEQLGLNSHKQQFLNSHKQQGQKQQDYNSQLHQQNNMQRHHPSSHDYPIDLHHIPSAYQVIFF